MKVYIYLFTYIYLLLFIKLSLLYYKKNLIVNVKNSEGVQKAKINK